MIRFTFLVIAILALLSSSATAIVGNSRYHSAKCLAMRKKCNSHLERQSGSCRAGRYARNQSRSCHERACAWCKVPGKASIYPCSAKNVRAICKAVRAGRRVKPYRPGSSTRAPSTRPPTTRRPTTRPPPSRPAFESSSGRAGCVYTGSNRVVVDLGKVPMASGWTRTSRGGMTGVVFRKEKGGGIESASKATTMCFRMKASTSGDYLVTAVSAAPHPTEHNDMWVSSSEGFKLLKNGEFKDTVGPNKFLKGYENEGGSRFADYLSTVDHNGHALVIPNLAAGKVITYCMSGRSSKYEVFKLIIVRCAGGRCTSGLPGRGTLVRAAPSRCT